MEPDDTKQKYILNSVDNALTILNLFFDYEELSTVEIAKLVGVSRSTAFRFMITLENRGFLAKTEKGTYRLGLNLFSLGMLAYNRMELAALLHPLLTQIAHETGETCHLGIFDDSVHIMFIDKALGTSQLKMDTALGYRQYAHCTATGKAILAFQSSQTIQEYLKKTTFEQFTTHSISNAKELLSLLKKIKQDGYACDNEEAEWGLTCYAVPILDASQRAFAAVSISGPTTRMTRNKDRHIKRLQSLLASFSKKLY